MSKKLRHDDGRAVDLLLNGELTARHGNGNGNGGGSNGGSGNGGGANDGSAAVVSRAHGKFSNRLESAERVLRLLDAMPTADPPADLVARTLRRIDESQAASGAAAAAGERAGQHPFMGGAGTRPHA
jgi:hypothetical protein